ncbi:MAG TPA: hypothetical protein DHN29_24570 [Cytophagales bacterium]|nr:hypothetical protein [Cytophagales bacterium]|tara:strand:- start:201 stop:440 length:240 start_codon:yes stop_codon:yes gene_type:complete
MKLRNLGEVARLSKKLEGLNRTISLLKETKTMRVVVNGNYVDPSCVSKTALLPALQLEAGIQRDICVEKLKAYKVTGVG